MHTDSDIIRLRDDYAEAMEKNKQKLVDFLHVDYLPNQPGDDVREKNLDRHIYGRSRYFFNSILPWMNDFFDLSASSFIEIGPGTGTTTAPLALAAKAVHAYDISYRSAEVGRFRCELLNLNNVHINISDPDKSLGDMHANHQDRKVDAVLLFAVLEHMPVSERLETLRAAWDVIADNGYLIVGDTPNRLTYYHGHTARMPFFDMVPGELTSRLLDQAENRDFSATMRKWISDGMPPEEIDERIDRWGRGVSFHEFQVALGSLAAYTLAEGLERRIIRAIPIAKEEKLLMEYLNHRCPEIPLGFGRRSLYLIFQKNEVEKINLKRFDEDLVRGMLGA